jgi:hypothetical protein
LATGADTTIQMYYDYTPDATPSYEPEIYTPTETLDSDFTSTSGWTSTDTRYAINTGLNAIEADNDGVTDNLQIGYDLTTALSNTKWVIDLDVKVTAVTSAESCWTHIGMYDVDTTVNDSTNKDFLGMIFFAEAATMHIGLIDADNSLEGTLAPTAGTTNEIALNEQFYLRMTRLSATQMKLERYSDSARTILVSAAQTRTLSGNPQGLDWFKITNRDVSNSGILDLKIENVRIWDGISTFDREPSTWNSNYKAVHHLQGNSTDSTSNGNDGTDTAVSYEQQNNSVGADFNGSTSLIGLGSDASLDDNIINVSATINPNSDGETSEGSIFNKRNAGTGWMLHLASESGGYSKLRLYVNFSTTAGDWITTNAIIPNGELSYITLYYDRSNVSNNPVLIVNGIKYTVGNGITENGSPAGTFTTDASENLNIGNNTAGGSTFDGYIDNTKVSDTSRPSSEAITSYNAEKSDSDIITAGDENTQ